MLKSFDPIRLFIEKNGIDISLVEDFIIGRRYAAVVLKNGNIGLAANIINADKFDFGNIKTFDVEDFTHRLFLLAFFNAQINNSENLKMTGDIFDVVDFSSYRNTVMIGYSVPMVEKLKKQNCFPSVFDIQSEEKCVINQDLMPEYIENAQSLILTGTSIINNTFKDILSFVNKSCDVFLIGPSVPLSTVLLKGSGIKGIFGTQFKANDKDVIRLIKQNEGTNCLKKIGKKLILLNSSNADL